MKSSRYLPMHLLALLLALLLVLLLAQRSAVAVDLQTALQASLAQEPMLRASVQAHQAARELQPQALAALLPNLSANANPGRIDGSVSFFSDNPVARHYRSNNWALKLTQPIFRPQRLLDYVQAKTQTKQAQLRLQIAERDLILSVCQAYFDILIANDEVLLASAQRKLGQEQLSVAELGLKIGRVLRADVLEAEMNYRRNRTQELQASNDLMEKRNNLARLTQLPLHSIIGISNSTNLAIVPHIASHTAPWLAQASEYALEVQAKKLALESAQYEVKKQWAVQLPTVDLTLTRARYFEGGNINLPISAETNTHSTTLGLQINIPLLSGGESLSKVRQSQHLRAQAEAELAAARLDAQLKVKNSLQLLKFEQAQMESLVEAIKLSEILVGDTRSAVKIGSKINTDILAAQQRQMGLQRDFNRLGYQSLLQGLRLRAAAGALMIDDVLELNAWLEAQGKEVQLSDENDGN